MGGFVGACMVDSSTGVMLGALGGGLSINLQRAATGNSEVVRAKRKTMDLLGLDDAIEDILITLDKQYHLIRPVGANADLFIYLVLDRAEANLGLGRMALADSEKAFAV